MMTKEGSTKIVNFMIPRGSCARACMAIQVISENAIFL